VPPGLDLFPILLVVLSAVSTILFSITRRHR
jgi:hypothetical protein